MIRTYLDNNIPGTGYPIEWYILFYLNLAIKNKHTLKMKYYSILERNTVKEMEIKINNSFKFLNQPNRPTTSSMFTPYSSSFEDIDASFFILPEDILYLIQITISQESHKDSFASFFKN